jgi:hypothetical protein
MHVAGMRDHELVQNFILESLYGKDHSKDLDACDNIILVRFQALTAVTIKKKLFIDRF